jgi:hypothetical protein
MPLVLAPRRTAIRRKMIEGLSRPRTTSAALSFSEASTGRGASSGIGALPPGRQRAAHSGRYLSPGRSRTPRMRRSAGRTPSAQTSEVVPRPTAGSSAPETVPITARPSVCPPAIRALACHGNMVVTW